MKQKLADGWYLYLKFIHTDDTEKEFRTEPNPMSDQQMWTWNNWRDCYAGTVEDAKRIAHGIQTKAKRVVEEREGAAYEFYEKPKLHSMEEFFGKTLGRFSIDAFEDCTADIMSVLILGFEDCEQAEYMESDDPKSQTIAGLYDLMEKSLIDQVARTVKMTSGEVCELYISFDVSGFDYWFHQQGENVAFNLVIARKADMDMRTLPLTERDIEALIAGCDTVYSEAKRVLERFVRTSKVFGVTIPLYSNIDE